MLYSAVVLVLILVLVVILLVLLVLLILVLILVIHHKFLRFCTFSRCYRCLSIPKIL